MKRVKLDFDAELEKKRTVTDEDGNETEESCGIKIDDAILIDRMILLAIDDQTTIGGVAGYLRVMLGVVTNEKKKLTLTHYLKPDDGDTSIVNAIRASEVFVGGGMTHRMMDVIGFYSDDDDPAYATDFDVTLNMEAGQDEFYGSITEDGITTVQKFGMPDNIRVGIEMLANCLATGMLGTDAVSEIDRWLSGVQTSDVEYRVASKFDLSLISKPIKKEAGRFVGIMALNIKCFDETKGYVDYDVVMSYTRSTKLKTNDEKVVKLALLESVAKDYYTIGQYSTISMISGGTAIRLIAYDKKNDKFVVITCTQSVYQQFIDMIEAI